MYTYPTLVAVSHSCRLALLTFYSQTEWLPSPGDLQRLESTAHILYYKSCKRCGSRYQ